MLFCSHWVCGDEPHHQIGAAPGEGVGCSGCGLLTTLGLAKKDRAT